MENETYLSDWLAGKISDEKLEELVGETEYLAFKQLRDTLDGYTIPEPDMERNFSMVKLKRDKKESPKQKRIIPLWSYAAIAASLLLFFGLFQLFYFSNVTQTDFGTLKVLSLPDNSKVTINAKSKLSFPNLFQYNRTLHLEGEAYFEVQKGSTFTVKTALGNVRVLGTKFNVNAHSDYFEVVCYEGKVRVESKGKIAIVTPSEHIRFYDHTMENWADASDIGSGPTHRPSWISGETTFRNVPVQYVFNQFQNQYNVKIDYPEKIKEVKFTGAFTNKDKATALKTICIPLSLKYKDLGNGKIIISE